MKEEILNYQVDEINCKGILLDDPTMNDKKPGVLVIHAWKGLDAFTKEKAKEIVKLGYVAFCVDLYGDGKQASSNDEASALMTPLFLDRSKLKKRILAGYNLLKKHPKVDPMKLGAIGYCFGGITAIELFRSGVELKGAVCFHGLLANEREGVKVKPVSIEDSISGSLLILHGAQDPLCTEEGITGLQNELSEANVDWQMHIYGNAMHAFTKPEANDPKTGFLYDKIADRRSWALTTQFLQEVFE